MRILFGATAGAGHVGPLLPVAREVTRAGHEALFLLPPAGKRVAEAAGFRVHAAPAPDPERNRALREAIAADPDAATTLVNRDYFGRLCTEATLPEAERVCARWRPDLVLHEAAEYASALAAHRAGIKHAQIAIGLAEVEWTSLHRYAGAALEQFATDAVEIVAASPYLSRLPAALDASPYRRTLRYRTSQGIEGGDEPADTVTDESDPAALWGNSSGCRLVYATLGSMAGRSPFAPGAYRVLLDAFAKLGRRHRNVRVLLTLGRDLDLAALGPIPPNTTVAAWVPQERAFAVADVVVSHGGSGTAFGALAAGLPSVFFPLFADQPSNAELISAAGAGIAVDTVEVREHGVPPAAEPADRARLTALADEVAQALTAVLRDPAYAARALELGNGLATSPRSTDVVGEITRSDR